MLRAQYIVVEHDGLWKVKFEGRHFGPYEHQRAAVHAAIEAAERTPKSGYEPRVMVQSRLTGEFKVEWSGGDPRPADMPRQTASPEPNGHSRKRAG